MEEAEESIELMVRPSCEVKEGVVRRLLGAE